MTPRGCGCIIILVLLLALAATPVSASVADPPVPVPVAAVGVPNFLQEKGKITYTWEDFQEAGEWAAASGNYDDAVGYFNKAEELLFADDPGRSAGTDYALSKLEYKKALAYAEWGGHKAEADAAFQKSAELTVSAEKKSKITDVGCLIVTATFGSPLASEVQLVRSFRDDSIVKSYTGSRFMPGFNAWYYSFSPQVSTFIREHPFIQPAMQVLITPILQIVLFAQTCYSLLSFNTELATIAAIVVGSTLYGLIYVFPVIISAVWVARRRGWDGGDICLIRPAVFAWAALIVLIVVGIAFSLDLLTTIASGLLVIATIVLTSGALSLMLSRHIGPMNPAAGQ
jgi:hypothetical protein